MDRAVANLQLFTGAPLATAVHLASRNPARMLGLDSLADVAPGLPANLNVFTSTGALHQTILRGHVIPSNLSN